MVSVLGNCERRTRFVPSSDLVTVAALLTEQSFVGFRELGLVVGSAPMPEFAIFCAVFQSPAFTGDLWIDGISDCVEVRQWAGVTRHARKILSCTDENDSLSALGDSKPFCVK